MSKKSPQLYLASNSPRRRELLNQLDITFEVIPVSIDETTHANEQPQDYVCRMALEKARVGSDLIQLSHDIPIIGSDTSVVLEGAVYGKPRDKQHAFEMLRSLSGQTHEVMSAVALVCRDQERVALNTSLVTLKDLTDEEIESYWKTGEPADKAGGYGIQGKAARFISHLSGSFSAVMGLPLYETAELLEEFSVRIR